MSSPGEEPEEPNSASGPADFRKVVGHFATGVTIVTTVADLVDHAMTASAFTSVSLEPPLVLVCVDKEARFRDAVRESGLWGVSLLTADARPAAEWLALRGRPLIGQLDRCTYRRGKATGSALLSPSLAWLECRSVAVYDGGDHDILLGEVLSLEIGSSEAPPLLYYRGRYRQLS